MNFATENFPNISAKIKKYHEQIEMASNSMLEPIQEIANIIQTISPTNTIYITGIGKSFHVAKKSISTWQCLNIHTQPLFIQDLTHGDFGILREGDLILYISNSGNTKELIDIAKYIKANFHVIQICLTNNSNCELQTYMDHSFLICSFKIQEADTNNIIPTVSSVIFMMALDLIGLELSERHDYTLKDLKRNHPNGLGKNI